MHKRVQKVISVTQDCASICLQTIQYCQQTGGAHANPAHLQVLQDCADICETGARFASRASAHAGSVMGSCADICDLCAASCETFADDPQMKACANQCLLCAAACRQSSTIKLAHPEAGQHAAQPFTR